MFIGIATILVFGYLFFFKGDTEEGFLSSSTNSDTENTGAVATQSTVAQDFLPILLSVKSLKLDDSIFSDPAFLTLYDSSIILVPDGNEGRPNPFAPIGSDIIVTSPPAPPSGTGTGASIPTKPSTPQ